MKKVALFFIAIAALILGVTTKSLLTGPGGTDGKEEQPMNVCSNGLALWQATTWSDHSAMTDKKR